MIKTVKMAKTETNRKTDRLKNIKTVILDFDNTLEIWCAYAEKVTETKWIKTVCNNENLPISKFSKIYKDIKAKMLWKEIHYNTDAYSRGLWLSLVLEKLDKKMSASKIKSYNNLYWKISLDYISLYSGAEETLKYLREKGYGLIMLTDSDGDKKYKNWRLNRLKIKKYFNSIITTDDTKANKPSPKNYEYLINNTGIIPKETAVIGDSPKKDLSGAKKFGITTILVKQGMSRNVDISKYKYIDYALSHIKDVPKLL